MHRNVSAKEVKETTVETIEINVGVTYAGNRWRGDRKVTEVKREHGQDAVVHYVDQRTLKTGNSTLKQFAACASELAKYQA